MQLYSISAPLSQQRLAAVTDFLNHHHIIFQHISLPQKPTQKWLKTLEKPSLLIDDDGRLFLIADGMKVTLNWSGLQQRVVKAGKKSELLLKVAKLQPDRQVIDATAGFGHDSLIMASTGAQVQMVEENPVMYLLLQAEIEMMQTHPNWQKLLARLTLTFGKFQELAIDKKVDTVFLDPMFPDNSYKSAQVNKNMQVLHTLAAPPSLEDEVALLNHARACVKSDGKVIVKRPKHAPFLANIKPVDSLGNELIRYDSYSAANENLP